MKKTLSRSLHALSLAAILSLLAYILAPVVIEATLLPRLFSSLGLPLRSVSISSLSPFSINGSLEIGADSRQALNIPRFEIRFSPASLARRQIVELILDHADIHLVKQGGMLAFPEVLKPSTPPGTGDPSLPVLPLRISALSLKACSVTIEEAQRPDRRLIISSHTSLGFENGADNGFTLRSLAGTFEFSGMIVGSGSLAFEAGSLEYLGSVKLRGLGPAGPLQSSQEAPGVGSGSLSAEASVSIDTATHTLNSVSASGTITGLRYDSGTLALRGVGSDDRVDFSITGSPEALAYEITPVAITRPLKTRITGHGTASLRGRDGHAEAALELLVDPPAPTLEGDPLPLHLGLSADFTRDSGWEIQATGRYKALQQRTLIHQAFSAVVPGFEFSAGILAAQGDLAAEFSITSQPLTARFGDNSLKGSNNTARIRLSRGSDNRLSATLSATIGTITLPEKNLEAREVRLTVPVELPLAGNYQDNPGSFAIEALSLNGGELGALSATIMQRAGSFEFDGSARSLFSENLVLTFTGLADPQGKRAVLSWVIPETSVSSSALPPPLGRDEKLTLDARLEASGNLEIGAGTLRGAARAALSEGKLSLSEKNMRVGGITCSLELPELPSLSSSPSQVCTFETLDAGRLTFSDGSVTFRLEDARTLFIEKSRAGWCRGTLETGSLRLSADTREIDTTLYCSRINFADLLNQFGLDQTQGQGALNGKLPIRLSAGGLRFDDGFLFSTPGTGGIVRFNNTDILRQGMSSVNQAGYLNYSMEALKNFAYDWTRLTFNTAGDELLLAMELEGAPKTPLPYGFRDGMIVPTDKGDGLQYPIRLDVNFRLPLTRLFQVGQNIKAMMENL